MPTTHAKAAALAALIGFAALGGALVAGANWPAHSAPSRTPEASTVADGGRYFTQSCAHCHADDATGDEGPSLRRLRLSDAHFGLVVKLGIKGEMPAFAKKYDDTQVAAIAAYLRTLDGRADGPNGSCGDSK